MVVSKKHLSEQNGTDRNNVYISDSYCKFMEICCYLTLGGSHEITVVRKCNQGKGLLVCIEQIPQRFDTRSASRDVNRIAFPQPDKIDTISCWFRIS